jgi:hypothetical protein
MRQRLEFANFMIRVAGPTAIRHVVAIGISAARFTGAVHAEQLEAAVVDGVDVGAGAPDV